MTEGGEGVKKVKIYVTTFMNDPYDIKEVAFEKAVDKNEKQKKNRSEKRSI